MKCGVPGPGEGSEVWVTCEYMTLDPEECDPLLAASAVQLSV